MAREELALEAAGLTLRTRRGQVYGPVDLALAPGETAMLVGAAGSGKTALLLTLGARMRPTAGRLRIAGVDAIARPEAARRAAAFGIVAGVSDLAASLSVRDTVRRDLAFAGGPASAARVARALAPLGGALDPGARVGDLTAGQHAALGIALALAAQPAVLLVDAIDADLSPAERDHMLALLRRVAADGTAVVGSCVDPATARGATVVVPMVSTAGSEVTSGAFA